MPRKFAIDLPATRRAFGSSAVVESGLLAMASEPAAIGEVKSPELAPRARALPEFSSTPLLPSGMITCPTALACTVGGVYYWQANYYFDTTNCLLVPGTAPYMTSTEYLTVGCRPSGCSCVPSSSTHREAIISKFPQTSSTRRHAFGSKSGEDPRVGGLQNRLPSSFVLKDKPGTVRVLEQRDYELDALPNRIRLFLMLYTPPETDQNPRPPVLMAVGQETDRPRDGVDPRLEYEQVPGERYFLVYRREDNLLFHVLTQTKIN